MLFLQAYTRGHNLLIKKNSADYPILCSELRCNFLSIIAENLKRTEFGKCNSKSHGTSAVRGWCYTLSSHSPANANLSACSCPERNCLGAVQGSFQRHVLTKVQISWWNVSFPCNECLNSGNVLLMHFAAAYKDQCQDSTTNTAWPADDK